MRLRMLLLAGLAGLTGAGVVVLPALAASEATKLEVNQNCDHYTDWPCWTAPGGSPTYVPRITIAPGATIAFADQSATAADVVWLTATPPSCSGVPATKAEANWEGSCKFETPGTYRFESSTLYPTYREYEIVVSGGATGTTPTGTTGTTPTDTSTSTSTSSTATGTSPSGSPTPAGSPSPLGSLFVGSATSALKLPGAQHGHSVHGSVDVSAAGAGGSLEVQLLASRTALAASSHAARVQVGKLVRSSLQAGPASFAVSLDPAARHALREHGHLEVSVKLLLRSAQGATATLTRTVLIRP